MNPSSRIHSLDNLRAVMMWLGIVLHVAINHLAGKSPLPWRDPETTPVADFILIFIHTFRMPVFFILAGFFVALLMARRGAIGMLKHRLLRIGLPFLIFWPLLFVCTGALISQYVSLMPVDADGQPQQLPDGPLLQTMHLWFLYYLLWFCALAGVCTAAARHIPESVKGRIAAAWRALGYQWWGFLILTLPLAAIGQFYWNGLVAPNGSFLPNIAELLHHGLFFTFGFYLYRHQDSLLPRYLRYSWRYAGAGLVFFLAAIGVMRAFIQDPHFLPYVQAVIAFLYHCASWLWSFALIGLFMRYLPARSRSLAFFADSSYWVYLVHFPLTIGFGVMLYEVPFNALAKMGINLAATTAVCLLTYLLLVRYTPVSKLLNGYRHPLPLQPRTLSIAAVLLFIVGLGITQIRFAANDGPTHHGPPARIAVPEDIEHFLRELAQAYGSKDSAAVADFLAQDFLYQGMDRVAFLDHVQKNRQYIDQLAITPVAWHARPDGMEVIGFGTSKHGVLAPSLQLLPLQAGAKLVRENDKWKLHGNQQRNETSLYRRVNSIVADFAPADLDAYRRHLPKGYAMPERPYVRVSVSAWERMDAPQRPYRLAQLSILANKDGDNIWHLLAMPETDWLAVEAGKSLGFPKFVADIDIRRSLGNQWQVSLQHDGATLADIRFDAVITTKTSRYRDNWPNNGDDWLFFAKDGSPVKASFQPLTPPRGASSGFGWMTVDPQAPLWKELLGPGSRALAMHMQADGAFKLHVYPAANIEVPPGIRQLLDANAAAWANQDMGAVLALHHPAFKVTNQKDLAAMRKLFPYTRRYEWQVKEWREEGDFVTIRGEIRTEAGAIPATVRLFRENGRWLFYGDGGSWQEQRRKPDASREEAVQAFSQRLARQAQDVLALHDDLRFTAAPAEFGPFSKLSNAVFQPKGQGPFPALVLLPDCSGRMGPAMRLRVEAGIAQGYVVMVVDSLRDHPSNCAAPLRVSFERRLKDAYDALAHLSSLPQVDPRRIAVAGYSQGGAVVLMLASKQASALFAPRKRFAAGVAWYPLCYMSSRYSRHEMDFLRPDIDTPLLLLMGGDDIYTPAYDCEPHLQELHAQGKPVEWQVFPHAGHGWDLKEVSGRTTYTFRGDRMVFSYDAAATQQGQQRMYAFLNRKLSSQPGHQAAASPIASRNMTGDTP